MMSRVTIFWLVALAGMVLMTVTVSLEVDRVNNRIDTIGARKSAADERIALLDASYQMLVSPEQLRPLADRHLKLQEVRGDQLIALDKLPERIPLPTARRPEPQPERFGQAAPQPPAAQPPVLQPPVSQPPAAPPALPGGPSSPPWLEAQGGNALQPVTFIIPRRRPQ